MRLKIKVEDRIPTYPGRVVLKPVSGTENTYDMTRADLPVNPGTPINKVLFDSKADRVTEDVTVYVSSSGNDVTGTGEILNPFKTIQVAIDAIPKNLDGHTVTIEMEARKYSENIVCKGFTGGTLKLGSRARAFEIEGSILIDTCSVVELNASQISGVSGNSVTAMVHATNGSIVIIPNDMYIYANSVQQASGMQASYGSLISFGLNTELTVDNCYSGAVVSTSGSKICLWDVGGRGNTFGLTTTLGGTITYDSSTLESDFGDTEQDGGRIFTNL